MNLIPTGLSLIIHLLIITASACLRRLGIRTFPIIKLPVGVLSGLLVIVISLISLHLMAESFSKNSNGEYIVSFIERNHTVYEHVMTYSRK